MKSCGPLSASTDAHCEIERRVRGRLRLDRRHRLDQLGGTAGITDAPAGHAIGFRHPVHRQRAVVQFRLDLRRRGEDEVVIDQMLVHIVGHHPDMRVLHQHVGDRLQLGARIGGAGRVRRRAKDDPFGLRRDRLFQRIGLQLEAVRGRAHHRHRFAAGERHHFRIAHPIGRGDDDLVAGIDGGHQRVVEHLLAAGPDDDLVRLVGQTVLALKFGDDRLLQLGNAVRPRCTWSCRPRWRGWPPA